MEMMRVKSEENLGRRRMCVADAEAQGTRCVKRRRRDPAIVTLGCDDQSQQQQLPNQQPDQASAATTFAGTQEEAARAYDIAAIEYRGINAVTNFDLSTYIRWLNPAANNPVVPHESRANTEPQALASSNFVLSEESEPLFFHSNSFTMDDLNPPHKQEVFQTKIPIEPCSKSSSPTALGLLLRSSIFRELVEKNSNAPEDETDAEDTKNQQQVGSDDEYGIFYDGIGDIPFVCPSNGDRNELQERLPLPFTISQGNPYGTAVLTSMQSIN